mmetsp:Transcript_54986/g.120567  ORF Transcript_54986/g.120567 Transcript_54986/m.120567 type:complete len:203 (-) Transcript_54986:1310-1918(-)
MTWMVFPSRAARRSAHRHRTTPRWVTPPSVPRSAAGASCARLSTSWASRRRDSAFCSTESARPARTTSASSTRRTFMTSQLTTRDRRPCLSAPRRFRRWRRPERRHPRPSRLSSVLCPTRIADCSTTTWPSSGERSRTSTTRSTLSLWPPRRSARIRKRPSTKKSRCGTHCCKSETRSSEKPPVSRPRQRRRRWTSSASSAS